ncbi:MAG: DUF4190 domain-containing protein [Planctomycetaceae bacterium]|jgi:hypothetical protein|nr:DUF4190 domain-containing protein [Planctomycetaceae bacterium]
MRPHRATLILVLGISSLVCCGFLGIPAFLMGKTDLAAMADGQMDRSGEGMTNAGKICGIIGIIFGVLQLLALIGYMLIVAGLVASNS